MENEISKINSTVQVVCRIYKMIPKKYMAKLQTSIFLNGKKKLPVHEHGYLYSYN